jgi:hypothetical protein
MDSISAACSLVNPFNGVTSGVHALHISRIDRDCQNIYAPRNSKNAGRLRPELRKKEEIEH